MPTATVTSKGQITIPREVRDHLHVGTGDKIDFVIEANGAVRISPLVGSVRELYGFLRRRDQPYFNQKRLGSIVALNCFWVA